MVMNKYLLSTIEGLNKESKSEAKNIDEAKITVNESIGRAAFYYEKLRNVLDYQDERLFLKNAIKRIILRRAFFGAKDSSARLLQELVWAKYFENDSIPKSKIEEVGSILRKYDFIRKNAKCRARSREINGIVFGLAACEIEGLLAPPLSRENFVEFAKSIIVKNIDISQKEISKENLDIQIEILIERFIFKSDFDILRFKLLRYYNKYWPDLNRDEAEELCTNFGTVMDGIDGKINQNRNTYFSKYVRRYIPAFSVIWEIINQNGRNSGSILQDEEKLNEHAKSVIEKRNKNIFRKVIRALVRGIFFVLLTKVFLAFLIEVPYELKVNGVVNYLAVGINTTLPPLIMLISGLFIKIPGRKNTSILLKVINSAVLHEEIPFNKLHSLSRTRKRGYILFNTIYTVISLIIIALVVWGLISLEFEVVGIILFFLFISIVSFLGFRIRATARELEIKSTEDSLFSGVMGLVLLPFIVIGKFLSEKWSEYNFTLMFWDFIIEAPFKTIIGFLEGWFYFLREKREDFE